jgi:hypothetical protein
MIRRHGGSPHSSTCRFSFRVSYRDQVTYGDARCLMTCHRGFVSNSCQFFRADQPAADTDPLPVTGPRPAYERFRHVTSLVIRGFVKEFVWAERRSHQALLSVNGWANPAAVGAIW